MAPRSPHRNSSEGIKTAAPYEKLALYYKKIMEHVDYVGWAFYLNTLLKKHKREPSSLLELGAGTGLLAEHFKPASIKKRITTDYSFEMIRMASPKTAGYRVTADASSLPFTGNFDMMLMTYDAINYLSKSKIEALFKEVFRLLSENGVFIFDVTTEYNSLTYFEDAVDAEEWGNDFIVRRSWYTSRTHKQYNQFDFFILQKEGSYLRESEKHEQTIHPVSFFIEAAEKASLEVEGVYADFTTETDLSYAERIHFVLSKKKSAKVRL